MKYHKTESRPADEVGELLERKRSENFIFDLDELWDLESHN